MSTRFGGGVNTSEDLVLCSNHIAEKLSRLKMKLQNIAEARATSEVMPR